ncbi:SAGA complex subunit spt20 [Cyphellophora attinorum]|uniref:SAGA complex subunit spt20 n=1 Tax=Cyphellophora attinorum TaxID=1664694 RepID=A0A0N1HU19_9EURO|nr:SAGA complex subunit spt20 [Phialophora attinorum]KPI42743.1 SAGA complex subunit spt20 [Phialophora attinorum]
MAAVVASRPGSTPQTKKASLPLVQTNGNMSKPALPSSSPSTATKRLPGQTPQPLPPTPTSANTARANRRPHRITTRTGTAENAAADKRVQRKFPEPYVASERHILRKFKGRPPSLIVHLHPTNFRFDAQDGSFSYQSPMRVFIEHLQKQTIPHDMLEDFREAGVTFYDGWLIVKVIDHRHTSKPVVESNGPDNDKPFSVHNYNPHITPSPYAPFPTKQSVGERSSPSKQKDGASSDKENARPQSSKPEPRIYHVGLRPTGLSRHADTSIDALAPDPKSLNRKQSQINARGGVPQTPTSGVPSTPLTEKGPPLKKQKMKIDSKDLLEYEARIINATAPPLYLEPVANALEAQALLEMTMDPFHNAAPPSPKSRKRTIAELAADDAHAKQQERFMLIMDERNAGVPGGTNAAVDGPAANVIFQPRFEKFNALETIKRDMAEKKQQDKDRQLQEDEARRESQQRTAEDEKRKAALRQREQHALMLRKQQQEAHQMALQQQAAAQQAQQQQQAARQQAAQQAAQQQGQASAIPPQMQNQVMGNQARNSPVIRQGTPHAASSPVVNQGQGGAGSPARPGSALQHSHPMARGLSNQSRNGTPQIAHATPGQRNATPILRQGTPAQHMNMTQASPHGSMMAPTPQMAQAQAAMNGQMPNGMTPQQMEMQRRQNAMRMQQMQQQHQQAMMAGNPQLAHNLAQQNAMQQRQAAMQAQQQMHAQNQQQMAGSPAQSHGAYNKQLSEQMKAQMQGLAQAGGNAGSPVQHQMTPQQQQAALAHQQQQRMLQAQAQQQGQMMGNPGMQAQQMQQPQQQRASMQQQMQAFHQQSLNKYTRQLTQQAMQRYGLSGNAQQLPQPELVKIQQMAAQAAQQELETRRQQMQLSSRCNAPNKPPRRKHRLMVEWSTAKVAA